MLFQRSRFRSTLVLLALASALLARAQSAGGVYQGTLGNQQIVAEIRFDDVARDEGPPIHGRYFYRRHGIDIPLTGTRLEDGSLRLQEFQNGQASGAEWRLTTSGDQATGTFCKCDVRQPVPAGASPLKISLSRIASAGQAYEDQFLSFPLVTSSEVKVNDEIAYVTQTDPRFQAGLPHLTRFPDASVMDRVNKDLAHELNTERHAAAECLSQAQESGIGGDWQGSMEVALLTRDILSLVRNTEYFCGGAHPDASIEPLLYNLRTGAAFDFRDFFQVTAGNGIAKDGVVPRQRAYLPFFALYLRHYKMLKDKDKDCSEAVEREASLEGTLKVYFSKEGLVLFPEMPHVAAACGEAITVPYKELGPLLKSGSFASKP